MNRSLRVAKGLLIALTAPSRNMLRRGYLGSACAGLSVNENGDFQPWYTYPCIDFLGGLDFSESSVLEFGSGCSSVWWSARALSYRALETSPYWRRWVQSKVESALASVDLIEDGDTLKDAAQLVKLLGADTKYDTIIVDGFYRQAAFQAARSLWSGKGFLIFDNSIGYGSEHLKKIDGIKRIDFFGMAPGVFNEQCTSVFFQPDCVLF